MVESSCQRKALAIADKIESHLGLKVKLSEPMHKHTSFRVGGPADFYLEPTTVQELSAVIDLLLEAGVSFKIIGNGTNLLVSDNGYRGAIIRLGPRYASWLREGNQLWAEAGISLPVLAKRAANEGLSGLEFLSGIPGTVGGALYMNAGAWGSTIGAKVVAAWVLKGQEMVQISRTELDFAYRYSNLQKQTILAAQFQLQEATSAEIQELMAGYLRRRQESQPLGLPSAGSVFRNPPDLKAAKIIDELGLKGMVIGGAQVSPVHANFIVNLGYATASDIYRLILEVQSVVEQETGIKLKPEIEQIGFTSP